MGGVVVIPEQSSIDIEVVSATQIDIGSNAGRIVLRRTLESQTGIPG